MMKDNVEKYLAKGQMIFIQTNEGLKERTFDRNYYIDEYSKTLGLSAGNYVDYLYNTKFTFNTHYLVSGKKFLKMVLSGYFTDNDGSICQVFADGFKTNLGLYTDKLVSGEGFLLDEEAWKDMCNRYKIEVNWANK